MNIDDSFTAYETGMQRLLEHLGQAHPRYDEALIYQQRLFENIAQSRRYGDTETRRAERAQIVEQINGLALDVGGPTIVIESTAASPSDSSGATGSVTVSGGAISGSVVGINQGTINQTFMQVLHPTPPPYRTAVLRMTEDYAAVFGGRDAELATLDTFLAEDTRPCALLIAPTGRGKTALLIHWIVRVQQRGDWQVIFAPISLRYETASAAMTLGALATALAEFHGEREKLQTYNQTPDQLRPVIADYLRREPTDGKRLLLVIDGMDEAVGWKMGRDLFPREPGPHLRIVASARQMAHTSRADWREQLGWQTGQTCDLELEGLRREAVSDILQRLGNPLDKLATDVDLLAEIGRVSAGDPLTIRFLIEALRDGEVTPGKLTSLPPGLEAFVRDWLDELEQQSDEVDAVYALLSLCAVALGPLTNDDVEQLDTETFRRRATLNRAAKQVGRFIIGDGSAQSGYVFSHPRLRELFLEQVLSQRERAVVQQRFVAYGEAWYADRCQLLPDYVREFWIMHLTQAEEWDRMRQVLTEVVLVGDRYIQPWAAACYRAEGSYAGYLSDLDLLWTHAEEHNELALGLRCALIASSIRSLSSNLSPELLVGLVTVGTPEGKWSPVAALEHVRQMTNPARQVEALRVLVRYGGELPREMALDVAFAIADTQMRASALGVLAPCLSVDLLASSLCMVRASSDEWFRARAIDVLAPYLWRWPRLLPVALDIATGLDGVACFEALRGLAPYLPLDLLPTARAIAQTIEDDRQRNHILAALDPTAREEQIDWGFALDGIARMHKSSVPSLEPLDVEAELAAIRDIADSTERCEVLGQLAVHLPKDMQDSVWQHFFVTAGAIEDWFSVVLRFVPNLPGSLLPILLNTACRATDSHLCARAIEALAARAQLSSSLMDTALAYAQAIGDSQCRVYALRALVPYLPPDMQISVLKDTLEAALTLTLEHDRTKTLTVLAPYLSLSVQAVAVQVARSITKDADRAEALGKIARHLPEEQQIPIWQDALATARAIAEDNRRAMVLGQFASYLPATLLSAALNDASAIADDNERVTVLCQLVPHFPAEQRIPIWQDA